MKNRSRNIIDFFNFAEKLKTELRHSWTNDSSRQESVAEHAWMMSLLAMLLFKEIKTKVDELRVLKMIIVHDLVEVINGDIPAFEVSERKNTKHEDEMRGIKQLLSGLENKDVEKEIFELWDEFEHCETNEAKFAVAMDKAECIIQHNIADINTWEQGDFDINPYYRLEKFQFDEFLKVFKEEFDQDTMKKIEKSGNLKRVKKEYREKWGKEKK
jgi:putative hydrolase of HD superfamily